jgi:flagellar biogenesis protein FliO
MIGIIGLGLLSTYPVGLSAQTVRYAVPELPRNNVVAATYQEPAAPPASPNADNQLSQMPPAGHIAAADAALSLSPQKPRNPEPAKGPGELPSLLTVAGSLALVLGVFLLVVWVLRQASPYGFGALPGEAFEVLGRAALANRQQVHLLRCGSKLLLVCVSPTGAETLTEITDPAEVERLSSLCRQTRSTGPATALRRVFQQVERSDA